MAATVRVREAPPRAAAARPTRGGRARGAGAPAAAEGAAGDDEASLRELYGQVFSVADRFALTDQETARFRSDVDDTFYAADCVRAFALADMMHEATRRKFGADWHGNPAAGRFLVRELFSRGMALSAEDVVERLGFGRRVRSPRAAHGR